MNPEDVLVRNSLYKDCAEICKRAKFTQKWIRPKEKYKSLISPYFYNEDCKHPLIVPIIGWAGVVGLEVDLYRNKLWNELEKAEFKDTKNVLNGIGSKDVICNYIMSLCVLNHALEGIGSVIESKKLEFGLIVT